MPPLQKVEFKNSEARRTFVHWISNQLIQTIGDRAPLERKWQNAIISWHAHLPEGESDWPWPGAPDVEMPLTAIHSDPVYADMMQTLHAPADYWTPQALRPDRADHINAVREGMTALERRYIKMKRVNRRALLDQVILGTSVYKNHWRASRHTRDDYLPNGEIGKTVVRISQPRVECVPLQRFYFPANAWSLDPDDPGGAQWVAEEFFKRPAELRVWAQGGGNLPGFDKNALERVLKHEQDREDPTDQIQREESHYTPFENRKIRLFEVHARYDTNGDGFEEDVVAILHLDSLEVLRVLHNPFMHGKRPFHVTQYLPNFGILGKGIAEIDEWAQETATTLLNAQLHNVLLANTRMYQAPLGSNIQPGEPIYPGKIWLTGPDEKVGEIRMGEVYPSIFQSLGQMMQFAEMRTGVSEIRQGNLNSLPSRTPATSLLSILREGNKRFDMILSNTRDVHSEMGLRIFQNLAQYYRDDPQQWQQFFLQSLGEKDAGLMLDVLSSSIAEIEESFGVIVTATSAQVNKEVEKQSFIGLMQVVGQIGAQLVQVAQLTQQSQPGTPVYETGAAMFTGGVQLLKQLLERFDIQNPAEYLGNLEAISASLTQQGAQQGAGGGIGALGEQPAAGIPPQLLQGGQLGSLFGLG